MTTSLKIEWDDSLSTGVRSIDVQHKYLIDIINELAEAIEEGHAAAKVKKILNLLRYYAEWHFGREEECMARHVCPFADKNQEAHAYFMRSLDGFQQEYRESGGSEEIARRMYTELTDWLVSHIKKVDATMGDHVPAGS